MSTEQPPSAKREGASPSSEMPSPANDVCEDCEMWLGDCICDWLA